MHRLDRPTSGVVLMAKKKGALTNIQEQFRNGKVQKIYLARTQHKPDQDQGALRHWLVKDQKAKTARALSHPETSAQEALLRYHIVSCQESGWLWRIELLSGRFHQIRAQLSAIGCPVIGDTLYGGLSLPGYPGIALHALELHFYDPNTGEPVTVRAPQPESPPGLLFLSGFNPLPTLPMNIFHLNNDIHHLRAFPNRLFYPHKDYPTTK
ncbi:MAG: RluA family pseudouridine synthase [Haliscomenobacter sp.]|nr:RluA family pseudouridine synthase [Haliscomenobacter sp.]